MVLGVVLLIIGFVAGIPIGGHLASWCSWSDSCCFCWDPRAELSVVVATTGSRARASAPRSCNCGKGPGRMLAPGPFRCVGTAPLHDSRARLVPPWASICPPNRAVKQASRSWSYHLLAT